MVWNLRIGLFIFQLFPIFRLLSFHQEARDWSLNINLKEARDNEELIQLGDSQILRFIRELTNNNYTEKEIKEVTG